jgi:hypothetical protein
MSVEELGKATNLLVVLLIKTVFNDLCEEVEDLGQKVSLPDIFGLFFEGESLEGGDGELSDFTIKSRLEGLCATINK